MPHALAIGGIAAVALYGTTYWWRVHRARAAYAARLPVASDGVVRGAGPITLPGSPTHAALLIHGFGDTPQTLALLAEHLRDRHGWTVHAPLLSGHGRSLSAFDATSAAAWRADVRDAYATLRTQHEVVALVGLSMGAALATIEASAHADLPALVLIAPYLTPPASAERLAPLAGLINLVVPYLRGGDRTRSIFDPAARALSLGATAAPPTRIRDLVAVAHDARLAAASVRAPTLLLHSRTDYRIPVALAERHPGYFTAAQPLEQRWMDGGGHVITVDHGRDAVWAATADWLARFAGAPGSAERQK